MKTTTVELIEAAVRRLMVHGPDRVVINVEQDAIGPQRARDQHGINPDVVFIRKDGWMLGAPEDLEGSAFGTWADSWIAFVKLPEFIARPMSEYRLG